MLYILGLQQENVFTALLYNQRMFFYSSFFLKRILAIQLVFYLPSFDSDSMNYSILIIFARLQV